MVVLISGIGRAVAVHISGIGRAVAVCTGGIGCCAVSVRVAGSGCTEPQVVVKYCCTSISLSICVLDEGVYHLGCLSTGAVLPPDGHAAMVWGQQ